MGGLLGLPCEIITKNKQKKLKPKVAEHKKSKKYESW